MILGILTVWWIGSFALPIPDDWRGLYMTLPISLPLTIIALLSIAVSIMERFTGPRSPY